SGGVPGHIGTCVCPGDACQVVGCACKAPNAKTAQTVKTLRFIRILYAIVSQHLRLVGRARKSFRSPWYYRGSSSPQHPMCRRSTDVAMQRPADHDADDDGRNISHRCPPQVVAGRDPVCAGDCQHDKHMTQIDFVTPATHVREQACAARYAQGLNPHRDGWSLGAFIYGLAAERVCKLAKTARGSVQRVISGTASVRRRHRND
ncbi:MAG: hypothetical protein QOG58_5816, partial [Caballeronia sp.]|nr:hypothetical protein [Caballeronia sp.]